MKLRMDSTEPHTASPITAAGFEFSQGSNVEVGAPVKAADSGFTVSAAF